MIQEENGFYEAFLDKAEISKVLKRPESTIDYWRRNGKIRGYGFGREFRYKISEVLAALQKG